MTGPGNVRPISPEAITPHLLIEKLAEDIHEIESIYVLVNRKDGMTQTYLSGTRAGLCFAGAFLQKVALDE